MSDLVTGDGAAVPLYLSNWSSPALHGPGRKWTIMVAARRWEKGDGFIWALQPAYKDLREMKAGRMDLAEYKDRFVRKVEARGRFMAGPEMMLATLPDGTFYAVQPGDTLCCACSKEAAAKGECHRAWSAPLLVKYGWRVCLDGVVL